MNCDFCGLLIDHAWVYPAKDFSVNDHVGSAGAWVACGHCHQLIQDENHEGLAKRSVDEFRRKYPDSQMQLFDMEALVSDMHKLFRDNRLGAARKV